MFIYTKLDNLAKLYKKHCFQSALVRRAYTRSLQISVSGLSALELRHLIEQAFLPARCRCTLSGFGVPSLTIEIYAENAISINFLVASVDISMLNSSRAISNLIAELRYDLENAQPLLIASDKAKQKSL